METPKSSVRSDHPEVVEVLKGSIARNASPSVQRRGLVAVSLDGSRIQEVEAGESQVLTEIKTEAALDYKSYQALIDRAVDVFGDELIASRWLSTPSVELNGNVPLQVAQELKYAPARIQELFEPIFIRIEHGIYS